VLRVAETLGKRMVQVENRSADAVEQVGGEVVRIATVMETRLRVSDNAHAEALERLGGEIARISERLAERIASAERRSAQAIDDVGDQVVRATDKINARYERAAGDLADRIRASDERTARFLDEARERIDSRLGETRRAGSTTYRGFDAAPRFEAGDVLAGVPAQGADPESPFAAPSAGPTRARLLPPARRFDAPAPTAPALAPEVLLIESAQPAASPQKRWRCGSSGTRAPDRQRPVGGGRGRRADRGCGRGDRRRRAQPPHADRRT
jgi:localization factor PodJL